jgi:exonuclease SbcD
VKLLAYTDLHAAHQNVRSRTGSYRDDILTKLREIIALANEHEVDYLINAADTFDRKSPWANQFALVREMIAIMRDFPGERHLTVIGTHDVPTVITVLEPDKLIGGAARYPAVANSKLSPSERELHGLYAVFHPVPASYDLDKDPQNYAFDYRPFVQNMGESVEDILNWSSMPEPVPFNPDDPVITIAHGMIVPRGGSFFGDFTDAHEITKRTSADIVIYGHPHTPDGVYRTDPDGVEYSRPTFIAPGSISRRDASDYNRKRVPQVALIHLSRIIGAQPGVALIPLSSARPPEEVFAEQVKSELDENRQNARLDEFVRKLASSQIAGDAWSGEDLIDEIRSADAPESVRRLAESIVTDLQP